LGEFVDQAIKMLVAFAFACFFDDSKRRVLEERSRETQPPGILMDSAAILDENLYKDLVVDEIQQKVFPTFLHGLTT
jgi:hypothetical protein